MFNILILTYLCGEITVSMSGVERCQTLSSNQSKSFQVCLSPLIVLYKDSVYQKLLLTDIHITPTPFFVLLVNYCCFPYEL